MDIRRFYRPRGCVTPVLEGSSGMSAPRAKVDIIGATGLSLLDAYRSYKCTLNVMTNVVLDSRDHL